MCWNRGLPNSVKCNVTAITPFKVIQMTDFSTNRKLIYDFLLVILILTYLLSCTVSISYGWLFVKFLLTRAECLALMLSLGVIPCQYRHEWYIAKNYIIWPTFTQQKVLVYLQVQPPLLRNPPQKLPNSVKLHGGWGYYAVQGHPRSPSLVPIESSYATSY